MISLDFDRIVEQEKVAQRHQAQQGVPAAHHYKKVVFHLPKSSWVLPEIQFL